MERQPEHDTESCDIASHWDAASKVAMMLRTVALPPKPVSITGS